MEEPRRKLDEYGPQEMAIPEWRLLQRIGGDYAKSQGAEPGQFYNNLSDEIADELNIVVVDILSGRARWGEEITSAGPVCASIDARSNKSIYGTDCNQCEFRADAPWSLEAKERRKMCCLNYIILGIDLDHDYLPAMIRAHGVSALPVRQLITQLKVNKALKGEYHKAKVNIKSVEKNTVYGITYTLHPRIIELITDEVKAEELRVESRRLLGTPIPLPEARPEGEGEPLGYTPLGTPFYSEEEKDAILAQETKTEEQTTTPLATTPAAEATPVTETTETKTPKAITETKTPAKEVKPKEKVQQKGKVDLDF